MMHQCAATSVLVPLHLNVASTQSRATGKAADGGGGGGGGTAWQPAAFTSPHTTAKRTLALLSCASGPGSGTERLLCYDVDPLLSIIHLSQILVTVVKSQQL